GSKAVEPSGAVCGHSPKRRGLPNAELTRKCGDLYVLIAQRHPKHCSITASANGVVNLADMRWLHELGRDLQKVAINRDGVWHLKEGLDLALLGRFRGFLWLGSGLVLRRWETQIDWVV